MSKLLKNLKAKFGESKVRLIHFQDETNAELSNYPFILIDIEKRSPIKLLMTSTLSEYKMPVLEKHKGKEFNELCFCLPSYWDLDDFKNSNMNWVFTALFCLQNHVLEKKTWFGVGHTIPFANPLRPISETMKQMYFFFNEAVFLKNDLIPIQIEDKKIHFLCVLPIFEDEFDFKIGKNTYKFQKKLAQAKVTELLDDYRASVLKNNWKFFGK